MRFEDLWLLTSKHHPAILDWPNSAQSAKRTHWSVLSRSTRGTDSTFVFERIPQEAQTGSKEASSRDLPESPRWRDKPGFASIRTIPWCKKSRSLYRLFSLVRTYNHRVLRRIKPLFVLKSLRTDLGGLWRVRCWLCLRSPFFEGLPSNNHHFHCGCWERQLMTDRTLDLTKALREAQLQRLEASLSARCATPTVKTQKLMKEKVDTSHIWLFSVLVKSNQDSFTKTKRNWNISTTSRIFDTKTTSPSNDRPLHVYPLSLSNLRRSISDRNQPITHNGPVSQADRFKQEMYTSITRNDR